MWRLERKQPFDTPRDQSPLVVLGSGPVFENLRAADVNLSLGLARNYRVFRELSKGQIGSLRFLCYAPVSASWAFAGLSL